MNNRSVAQTIRDTQNMFFSPFISKWVENNTSVIQTRNIMIIKEKRFKVIILSGKVMIFNNGLTKKNSKPMATPARMIVSIFWS
ncbi:MAG: hypothetical protein WC470_00525 [Candidatus Paceibacterota bacterium]